MVKQRTEKFKKSYPRNKGYSVGQRIGIFVIKEINSSRRDKYNSLYRTFKCLCDCGVEFIISNRQMTRKRKSCGCLAEENRFKKSPPGIVAMRSKMNHYKQSAKSRNLEWNLTEEIFHKLILGNCFYCKSPPMHLYKKHCDTAIFNGVDRYNNNFGYTIENSVSCCRFCNLAKSDVSVDKFLNWLERLKKL